MPGKLFIIPNFIGQENKNEAFPELNFQIVSKLKLLIVENAKNARAYLKRIGIRAPYDYIEFFELNKKKENDLLQIILKIINGENAGLISDAGYPSIADPGESIIELAQQNNITVKPLIGPSSIFLALAASGQNAENFTFHAYLPIKGHLRQKKLNELDSIAQKTGYSQIFMETPYRCDQMFQDILKSCRPDTQLTLAIEINTRAEKIITKPVSEWKKIKISLNKNLIIFILGRLNISNL